MEKSYLAFDLGASSGRGIIGKIKDGKLHLTEIHRFSNGPVEKEGSLYWEFDKLCKEIKTGIKKAVAAGEKISSIAIDTWGVDYVLFKNGVPVRMPYHYRDSRTNSVPGKVFEIIPQDKVYACTGIQFMQLNTLYQLYAHKEAHPEDFCGSVMLLMPDALTCMLNGDVSCEYSDASTSNLLDPHKREWDFELIDRLGIPRSIFPKIVQPCSKSLPLKKSVEDEIGCGPIPMVKVGSHDTASAVAAVPAPANKKWAYISCGTWALLGAEIDAPILTEEAGEAPFTNEGGLNKKIRFLTNIMGTWLFQETRRIWREQGRDLSFAELNRTAKSAEGLRFFINPNDNIFFTPGDMPAKVAAFCREHGQGEIPDDGALLRCIYDSLALCFRSKLEKLQELLGVKYECLNIVGGGTQDTLLMQLTADCLGIPVIAGPVEATAIGNILAQAIADNDVYSLAEARDIVRRSFEVQEYIPDASSKNAWDAAAKSFLNICN